MSDSLKRIQLALSEMEKVEKGYNLVEEFYFFMRTNHGHQAVKEALLCNVCQAMEQTKEHFNEENPRTNEPRLRKALEEAVSFMQGKLVCLGERHDCPSCNGYLAQEELEEIANILDGKLDGKPTGTEESGE